MPITPCFSTLWCTHKCSTYCGYALTIRCPRDVRRTITSHVLVVGGGSMLPGFCRRLGEEVRLLAEQRARYHDLTPVVAESHMCIVNDTLCPRNIALWVGGSLMAVLQVSGVPPLSIS